MPENNFYTDRLSQYGIKPDSAINKFEWADEHYDFQKKTWPYFEPHEKGIRINTPTAWGTVPNKPHQKRFQPVYRIRFESPEVSEDGRPAKYKFNQGGVENYLFIPPNVYEKVQQETHIPTLWVTEGEFKSFVPARWGLDIVGIPGIWNFKAGDDGAILLGLREILTKCTVENVVILYDSDCLDLSSTVGRTAANKNFDARPRSFMNAAKFFTRSVKLGRERGGERMYNTYMAYIDPRKKEKAGLDDLFKTAEHVPEGYREAIGVSDKKESRKDFESRCQSLVSRLVMAFEKAHAKVNNDDSLFHVIDTTRETAYDKSESKSYRVLERAFNLTNAREFYDYHKTRQLKGFEGFRFDGRGYKIQRGIPVPDGHGDKLYNPLKRKGNTYVKVGSDGDETQISSFGVDLHYVIYVNAERTVRIATFSNIYGQTNFTELEKQTLASQQKWMEKVNSWKGFKWLGSSKDLIYLSMLLDEQSAAKEAIMVETVGWNDEIGGDNGKGGRVMADGIFYDGVFYESDEYGIVSIEDQHYYLPFYSRLKMASENATELKWVRHVSYTGRKEEETPYLFIDWMRDMERVHNGDEPNGTIASMYVIYALFSSIAYEYFSIAPILAVSGIPRSGKSELARAVMHAFGKHEIVTTIQSVTTTAVNRLAAQFSDGVIWIDEWKNSIERWKQELIKSAYDRSGKAVATFTNDNGVKRVAYKSPFMLTGQDVPGMGDSDPAIFSRCIHLRTRRTMHDKGALDKLKDEWAKGLTHITGPLSKHRELVRKELPEMVSRLFDEIKHRLPGGDFDTRMLNNFAVTFAPGLILAEAGHITLTQRFEDFVAMAVDMVAQQMIELNDSNELWVWWHILEELRYADEKDGVRLESMVHYRIDGPELALHIGSIYDLYKIAAIKRQLRYLDKPTLLSYLIGAKGFKEKSVQKYMGPRGKQKCYVFDRHQLMEATGFNTWKLPEELAKERAGEVIVSQNGMQTQLMVATNEDPPF